MGEIVELLFQLLGAAVAIKRIIDNSEHVEDFHQQTSAEFEEPQINKKWETLGRTRIGKLKKSKKKTRSRHKS